MADNWKVLRPLGAAVLFAAGVMFAALFMPFVRQGCIFCPISTPGSTFELPTFSLMQGLDGWIVLCVVVAIGLEAGAYMWTGVRAAAAASFLLSLTALGLCVFEGVDSAGRVVGLDASAASGSSIEPPAYWNFGLYVFFGAALVAVCASLALVLLPRRLQPQRHDVTSVPLPAP